MLENTAAERMDKRFNEAEAEVHAVHDLAGNGYAGGPYSDHLKQVDGQLLEWFQVAGANVDPRLQMLVRFGGLLHDYFEDMLLAPESWPASIAELIEHYKVPLQSIDMALLCTDPPGSTRQERKLKAYPRIAQCYGALLIKLADRTCHLKASGGPESGRYLKM